MRGLPLSAAIALAVAVAWAVYLVPRGGQRDIEDAALPLLPSPLDDATAAEAPRRLATALTYVSFTGGHGRGVVCACALVMCLRGDQCTISWLCPLMQIWPLDSTTHSLAVLANLLFSPGHAGRRGCTGPHQQPGALPAAACPPRALISPGVPAAEARAGGWRLIVHLRL